MKIIHEIINRGKGSYGSGEEQLTREQLLRIYDETKSISSLILTTNGTSGAATYNSATRTLNIPVYTQSAVDGFVPYTGATANLNLGANQLIADAIQLSLLPVSPTAPGKLRWNADSGTLDIGMGYTDVVQQVGMDTYYPPIKNQTGSTIAKGTVVMSVGTLGASGRILVAPAVANGTIASRFMLGIAASDMINGADGLAIWFGEMKGFNTVSKAPAGETWVNGDVLWINPAIPGGLTKNEPLAPNLKVSIAQVLHAATNGIIVIRPSLGSRLTDLHDVNAFTPATNDLISYDGVKWVNRTLAQLNIPTGTGVAGQVAFWSGTGTQTGDSGLFWNNVNKRLGVNRTPFYALDVQGILRIKDSVVGGRMFFESWTTEDRWEIYHFSTDNTLRFNYNGVGGDELILRQNGGVNIQSYSLTGSESNSALGITGTWNTTGTPTALLVNINDAASNAASRIVDFQIGGSSLFQVRKTGAVLINTTTDAGFRLDVNGTARVQGAITGTSSLTLGSTGNSGTINLARASTGATMGAIIQTNDVTQIYNYQGSGFDFYVTGATSTQRVFIRTTGLGVSGDSGGTFTMNASAALQINSTTQGFLPPRLTSAQRDAIASPATGLQLYNSTSNTPDFYNGTSWVSLQTALTNPVTGTGVAGQVAFWSGTGSQTGDSGLVWNNTFKTLGVGTPALINIGINNAKTLTGGIFSAAYQALGQIQSDVTNTAFGFYSGIGGSSTLNISNINHFTADQGAFVSGAVVGVHTGFRVNNLSTGNEVRGISLAISAGANRWNIFASGNASNYLAGNLLLNTTTDAGFRLDVNGTTRLNGLTTIQGTTASDSGQLGSELLTTGTGDASWTGTSFATGYTHVVGSTTTLTSTLAGVVNTIYQITYTVTGRTAGSFTIAFGGFTSSALTATGAVGPRATTTDTLVITPTSDFNGTIVLSIRVISISSASVTFNNSAGTVTNQIRISGVNTNTFLGFSAGFRNTTGNSNSFYGSSSGSNNTTGVGNSFYGTSSGQSATIGNNNSFYGVLSGVNCVTGSGNSFFGRDAGFNTNSDNNSFFGLSAGASNTTGTLNSFFGNSAGLRNTTANNNSFFGENAGSFTTTGNNNSFFGRASGLNNTTGSSNVIMGFDAGRRIANASNLTIANNSVFVGTDTRANADNETNQIVIGHTAVGLGTNTTVIGNSSTTFGRWWGNLLIGTSTNSGDALRVNGTVRIDSVTNATGDFVTIDANNVLRRRTASETRADIGAQATLTNPVTGTGVAGQVAFWSGTGSQTGDNGLFWDNTNKRLGVGTTTPFTRTDSTSLRSTTLNSINSFNTLPLSVTDTTPFSEGVGGGINFRAFFSAASLATYASIWSYRESSNISDYRGALIFATANNGTGYPVEAFRIASTRNLLINTTTDAGFRLDVNGTARIQGSLTTNLTAGRVPFIGTGGVLSDDSGFVWDNVNSRLAVNQRILLRTDGVIQWGNALTGNSRGTLTWDTNLAIITSGESGALTIRTGGSNRIFIQSNGNIGINTTTDAGFRLDVNGTTRLNGLTTIQGTTASDSGQLGSELLTTGSSDASWTGTSFATGYTHVAGSTTTLTSTLAGVVNNFYQITYTVTGRTTGSFTVAFGGFTSGNLTVTGAVGPRATTTDTLVITPTSDFNGTIVLSIRIITASSASVTFNSSAGTTTNQIRISSIGSNTFIGLNAGRNNTTGVNNSFFGVSSGQNNTTGVTNSFFGINSGLFNTTGLANSFFGGGSGQNGVTGSENTGIGVNSGQNNTTGSGNTFIGSNSGRFIANGSTALTLINNSVFLGASSRANADNETNQIVIGHTAIGLGTNTTVIGNSSTTFGRWWGRLLVGTSTDSGDAFRVNGTVRFDSNSILHTGSNPVLRIATTDNNSTLNFRNNVNEDAATIEARFVDNRLDISTRVNNMDIRISPHGTGKINLPSVPTGTGDILMRDSSNNLVRGLETGTFTPTLTNSGDTGNLAYSFTVTTARYTRLGGIVFFNIELTSISSSGTGSGVLVLKVGGLPFVPTSWSVDSQFSGSLSHFDGSNLTASVVENLVPVNAVTNEICFRDKTTGAVNRTTTFTNGSIRMSGYYTTY
jgi:hypothetical protein